jgi:general secretion pathway protein D
MNRLKATSAALLIVTLLASCGSYSAYRKAQTAETAKDWDVAVVEYERALEIDPGNRQFKVALDRARREASRVHFEKGKSLRAAASEATGSDQLRLAQLAATEFQLTVKLDTTNQFAAVELVKTVELINNINRATSERISIDEIKKRSKATGTKAAPPQLNPASDEPISLTFSRDTPVKDIYRALGNAFGINILFDQAIKDDRITIELRDVTAQQALERVMQAANHFYKTLDEKTIIVIPDNPQARRDYEDLVIQTFYLSNGNAEEVTNVVRTMIEARNVFPLKALNAITIRDTADKVRIAEKIIEANDKARAEVVVQVELVQLDLNRIRDIGFAITGPAAGAATPVVTGAENKLVPFTGGTLGDIARVIGSMNDLRNNVTFTIPTATYSLIKTAGNSELLANPELRISEGEKATLHIGQRIPVPVTTISGYNPGTTTPGTGGTNLTVPYTSFQYQDVGIKVAMEPRVHHNREVTLKLTVEVSNQGTPVKFAGQEQPTFATRTIESTIRLKDGETNFLAGLIQSNKIKSATKTPFLGDIPFLGRLFSQERNDETRTDLVLTMTPHIVRIPDITEEDVAPMWVGTGNNLTFRGVSPRIESQANGGDPFLSPSAERQFEGVTPAEQTTPGQYPALPSGTGPSDPFRQPRPTPNQPGNNPPEADESAQVIKRPRHKSSSEETAAMTSESVVATLEEDSSAALGLSPRLAPQPATLSLSAGETKMWNIIGMDLDGLVSEKLVIHFNPQAISVSEVTVGGALEIDPLAPPSVNVDSAAGTITLRNTNGKPLTFVGGGQVLAVRVQGGVTGDSMLILENPNFRDAGGAGVVAAVTGGRAKVQ